MNQLDFVSAVNAIAAKQPTYRTGGTGSDGTCDCIGLIMGALGGKFDLHSTNYFARYEMDGLYPLADWRELKAGDLVYKYRPDNGELNERYKSGGTHDTGDHMDYYHAGVVTSINPLEITHCTQTNNINGIARDTSIKGWDLYGQIADLEYEDQTENENENPATVELAVVYSENEKPVRMRKTPTTTGNYNTIAKVPKGAQVEVLETDGVWSTIRWNGQRGYMMNRYLQVIGEVTAPEEVPADVTIHLNADAAMELYKALSGVL